MDLGSGKNSNVEYKQELNLLRLYYRKLYDVLEIFFSGYLILSNDEIFELYLKLCLKIESLLNNKSFKKISVLNWRPFDNLRSLDPDAPDLDWEYYGRNLTGNFLSEIERLCIKSGVNHVNNYDVDKAFFDNVDLILRNYKDYKIKYEKKWIENMEGIANKHKKNNDIISNPSFDDDGSNLSTFRELYYTIDRVFKYQGDESLFKLTTKASRSLADLTIPHSERDFKEFIENLFIVIYEGSGNGKRLPMKLDENRIITKLKKLRNHFIHDQEHGSLTEIRSKHKLIGNIFQELIGTRAPSKDEHWNFAASELLKRINTFLSLVINNSNNLKKFYENDESSIRYHYNPDITIFPQQKCSYRVIDKKNGFNELADAPIFIPHFSLSWVPQFGPIKAAIHFSSTAYNAKMHEYKKFLNRVEYLWKKRIPYKARDTREFFSWSISSDGEMKYGSGVNNLINAIESTDIGIITIFLIGAYGEDYSKSFFIIISNYWKYGIFRDNYLDIYMSNMPLDFKWIEEINESLQELSSHCEIADSYSLKKYGYHFWKSEKKYELSDYLIGGIGSDGSGEDKKWDQFTGLIFKNPFSEGDFIFNDELSFNILDSFLRCPTEAFDEFMMSITNHPPSFDEIISGKFIGFNKPNIEHFIFDGHGHTIHALLFWGRALYDKRKETNFMKILEGFKINKKE